MSTKVKDSLGYQVPTMFWEREVAWQWLKDAGIKNPNKSIGKLYYILNHLRVTSHINGERYNNCNDGWVPIKKEIICKLCGNMTYVYPIINKLVEDELIEINHHYITGKECKKYRLKHNIDVDEWRVIRVTAAQCSTTRKVLEYSRTFWRPIDHKLYNLLTQFNIDEIPFFEQTTVHNFKDYPCEILDAIMNDLGKKSPQRRYGCWKAYYNDIKQGEWRYTPDKYGRRHNNLTNLPKALRKYLYIFKRGVKRRLVSVDIKNSQALLLILLLPKTLEGYEFFKESNEMGVFYELLSAICSESRPKAKYKDCIDGNISTELRKKIKKEYFHYLYGDNNTGALTSGNVFQAMKERFDSINRYICFLKTRRGYKYPAREMQKEESKIIIDYVCYRALNMQGLKFAQIYDSILCLEEDVAAISQLITEGFKRKGLNVSLEVEKEVHPITE